MKSQLIYKLNFSILIADIVMQLGGLILLGVIFEHTKILGGWNVNEAFIIYAIAQINFSIFSFFAGNIYRLSARYIFNGDLNKLLLRPINTLIQICIEELYFGDVGAFLVGIVVLIKHLSISTINFGTEAIFKFIILSLLSFVILTAIFIIFSAINFLFINTQGFQLIILRNINLSRYPSNIFPKTIKMIFTFVIPYTFIGFFPAKGLFNLLSFKSIIMLSIFVIFMIFISFKIWNECVKKYNSPGW